MSAIHYNDDTFAKCSCKDKREIKILFIGQTQAGKSTFIRSALQYGGHHEASKLVQRGNNTVSQTQVVSTYSVKISLKTHRLRNNNGKIVNFTPELAQKRRAQFTHDAIPSKKHHHFKFLDTPGLGDSGNYAAAAELFKHKSLVELSAINIVDEQHKLDIMMHMLKEETITAVCFIVKGTESYSNSMQENIKAYLDILNQNPLTYHVVHTGILPKDRSVEGLGNREKKFRDIFRFPSTHHFIDSEPRPDEAIHTYLSQSKMDEILQEFADSEPHKVPDVLYIKLDTHLSLDRELKLVLNGITKLVKHDIDSKREESQRTCEELLLSEKRLAKSNTLQTKLQKEFEKMSSDDYVKIMEPQVKEASSSYFFAPSVVFDISTHPLAIRRITSDPPDWGTSDNWTEATGKDTTKFHARYTGNRGSPVKASLVLETYNKEFYAPQIREKQKELDTCKDTIKFLKEQILSAKESQKNLGVAIANLDKLKIGLEKDVIAIWSKSVSVKKSQKFCLYLTTCNIIGICLANMLSQEIPRKYLPAHEDTSVVSRALLAKEWKRQQTMLDCTNNMLNALKADIDRKKLYLTDIEKLDNLVKEEQNWLEPKLEFRPKLDLDSLASSRRIWSSSHTSIESYLRQFEKTLGDRFRNIEEVMDEYNAMERHHLKEVGDRIKVARQEVKATIDEAEKRIKIWQACRQIYKSALSAVNDTIKYIDCETLPTGPFLVLYKIFIKPKVGVDAYVQLYYEVHPAYNIRDCPQSGDSSQA